MRLPNSNPVHPDPTTAPDERNTQGLVGLAEVLQNCCGILKSGQITFRSGASHGFVYLQHGRVLHAICGDVESEEAIYRMLQWPPGEFVLDEDILPRKKTVFLSWEQLLFEGARRADETGTGQLPNPADTVVTAEPVTSTRVKQSQPRLTLILPDERPLLYELQAEYTHVGRATGNEIPLPQPSVSNRHCIFILSGSDVVLRDLNSSNGTMVNGKTISEAILQPGDVIQIGIVQIKFEPGVRRPKLTQTIPTIADEAETREAPKKTLSISTRKIPPTPAPEPPPEVKDDSVFVKGQSAISYENLPKPKTASRKLPVLTISIGLILLLAILGGFYYFFIAGPH